MFNIAPLFQRLFYMTDRLHATLGECKTICEGYNVFQNNENIHFIRLAKCQQNYLICVAVKTVYSFYNNFKYEANFYIVARELRAPLLVQQERCRLPCWCRAKNLGPLLL